MNPRLLKFRITPRVLLSDTPQTITVEGLDSSYPFYDDIEYTVKITNAYEWNFASDDNLGYKNRNCTDILKLHSVNGVIKIDYCFKGEGEWVISITPEKLTDELLAHHKKYGWEFRNPHLQEYVNFSVFSLHEDLYNKKIFKGDLHVHTYGSDGWESPQMTAAQYRKYGFDFIAITDHYKMNPSLEAIETFKDIPTPFKIFQGEEVHVYDKHCVHMVNFNCKSSVNEKIENDFDNTFAEVQKIADTLKLSNKADRIDRAWYIWVYEQIKKSGGIAIYPHPEWRITGSYNVRESVTKWLFKEKLFDAFEIIGGNNKQGNQMQAQHYYTLALEGCKYPIVASSDCHSPLWDHVSNFNNSWTFIFAEDTEKIPENIMKCNTVAIDNSNPDDKLVLGDYRLVKYAWFLIENYFEMHDFLCSSSGQAILDYIFGDKENATLVSLLEGKIKKYQKEFFGKEY